MIIRTFISTYNIRIIYITNVNWENILIDRVYAHRLELMAARRNNSSEDFIWKSKAARGTRVCGRGHLNTDCDTISRWLKYAYATIDCFSDHIGGITWNKRSCIDENPKRFECAVKRQAIGKLNTQEDNARMNCRG